MATQYTDGTFGETLPLPEAVQQFNDALEAGIAKAFHVGTPGQIEEVKRKADLQDQIDDLADRLNELYATRPDGIIHIPTKADLDFYVR